MTSHLTAVVVERTTLEVTSLLEDMADTVLGLRWGASLGTPYVEDIDSLPVGVATGEAGTEDC